MSLRITSLEITNILGTAHALFPMGSLTVVTGANGQGKTSILDGIARVFEGGHDPGLLRHGSKFGEVVFHLSDRSVIKARITAKTTTYEITDQDGKTVAAPRAYIECLGDALAVNPARIVSAKPKELASVLLEVMPVEFSLDEMQAAVGDRESPPKQPVNLDGLEIYRKTLYDARRIANRDAADHAATAKSLKAGLEESDKHDWAARTKELRGSTGGSEAIA